MSVNDQQKVSGFALVLVLALLSIAVLIAVTLSALTKVSADTASSAVYQMQAKQNAMLGLNVALGELQKAAGPDDRITGMAGIVGTPEGNALRQWTGVWGGANSPVWLTSGALQSATPSLSGASIDLVAAGSVGINEDDKEWVSAGLLLVDPSDSTSGHYAYWTGDEGVKVSASIPSNVTPISSATGKQLRPDVKRLLSKPTFDPNASDLGDVLSLEQLPLTLTGKGVSIVNAFHDTTLTHRALATTATSGVPDVTGFVAGVININTTSAPFWRALLEYPDRADDAWGLSDNAASNNGIQIAQGINSRAAPLTSITDLRNSQVIHIAFATVPNRITDPTADEFIDDLLPILSVRSDTFRIRAYGDAMNPADAGVAGATPESVAYCEAIVQRTPEIIDSVGGPLGRRFVITYFRWLGPDDI